MPLRLVKDAQRRPQAAVPGRPFAALVLSLTAVIPCGHNEKEGVTSPGRSLPRKGHTAFGITARCRTMSPPTRSWLPASPSCPRSLVRIELDFGSPAPAGGGGQGAGGPGERAPKEQHQPHQPPAAGTRSPRGGGAPAARPPPTEPSAPTEGEGRRRDPRGMGGARRQTPGAQAAADNHARDRNQAARAAQQTAPDLTRGRDLRTGPR